MDVGRLHAWVTALLLAVGGSVTVGAESPLVEAVKAVDTAAVRSLLQKRADVNPRRARWHHGALLGGRKKRSRNCASS